MSEKTQLYKAQLMDHFKNPRNKCSGSLENMQFVRRGTNPRCGDDVEVGFTIENDIISNVQFRGRGCSVCLAATSMMTEEVRDLSPAEAKSLFSQMHDWINHGKEFDVSETLSALAAVKDHPARKKCVMLSWNALHEGLEASYA